MTGTRDSRFNPEETDLPPEISKRYGPAIRFLNIKLHKQRSEPWLAALGRLLIEECEAARLTDDIFRRQRQLDKDALEEASKLAQAANFVASYMRRFPHHGSWIAGAVITKLAAAGLKIAISSGSSRGSDATGRPIFTPDDKPVDIASAFERLHLELARSATADNPAHKGPWLWRSSVPGATFDQPIDTKRHKRPIEPATVLAFHLVFHLRVATTPRAPGAIFMINEGMPMPKCGQPHYRIAEEFVACALDTRFKVDDRLRKWPGMQYLRWSSGPGVNRKK